MIFGEREQANLRENLFALLSLYFYSPATCRKFVDDIVSRVRGGRPEQGFCQAFVDLTLDENEGGTSDGNVKGRDS